MPSLTKRRFLATGLASAVTVTAGCLGTIETGSGDSRSLSLHLSHRDGPLRDRYVVDLSTTRPERDEEAFESTLNGTRYTTQYRKPFPSNPEDPRYATRDGTYYRLGSVVVDEAAVTRPILRLREPGDERPSSRGIAATRLPAGDQRAVHIAHLAARARGNEGGVPWDLVHRGGYVYRREKLIEASRLLAEDGPDVVIYRDSPYRVEIDRERFHEPVYRATVEAVASGPERMEAILRAKFVDARLSRTALSGEARDVLREARVDGYSESHPYSTGYKEVLVALHGRAYLDGDIERDAFSGESRTRLLLYDDEYYQYRLRFRSDSP